MNKERKQQTYHVNLEEALVQSTILCMYSGRAEIYHCGQTRFKNRINFQNPTANSTFPYGSTTRSGNAMPAPNSPLTTRPSSAVEKPPDSASNLSRSFNGIPSMESSGSGSRVKPTACTRCEHDGRCVSSCFCSRSAPPPQSILVMNRPASDLGRVSSSSCWRAKSAARPLRPVLSRRIQPSLGSA